jgi:uncharacterized membrane protein
MAETRFTSLRNAFFSGLLLLAPLVVTVWAFTQIVGIVGGSVRPLYDRFLPEGLRSIPFLWDVLATLLVFVLITILGYVSRYFLGKYLLGVGERFMQTIPGVNSVYNTVKQIVQTFSSQNRNIFSKVVLVEFPRAGSHSIGFLTNKAQGEPQTRTAEEIWTVFIPTSPNPTSGFLLMLPRKDIVELEMSVGDGMKMVISGGAVVPPWPPTARPPVTGNNPAAAEFRP